MYGVWRLYTLLWRFIFRNSIQLINGLSNVVRYCSGYTRANEYNWSERTCAGVRYTPLCGAKAKRPIKEKAGEAIKKAPHENERDMRFHEFILEFVLFTLFTWCFAFTRFDCFLGNGIAATIELLLLFLLQSSRYIYWCYFRNVVVFVLVGRSVGRSIVISLYLS